MKRFEITPLSLAIAKLSELQNKAIQADETTSKFANARVEGVTLFAKYTPWNEYKDSEGDEVVLEIPKHLSPGVQLTDQIAQHFAEATLKLQSDLLDEAARIVKLATELEAGLKREIQG